MITRLRFLISLSIVTGVLLILTTACPEDDPEPEPTCVDGIQNGNETGVDCGGDCPPCFDCLTNYCALLTGATSSEPRSNIKWILIQYGENPPTGSFYLNFYSTGTYYISDLGQTANGHWNFNEPANPTSLTMILSNPPLDFLEEWTTPIHMLSSDTLKISSHGGVLMTLIPE